MNEITAIWSEWLKPSAGLPTVQWSILLGVAAIAGHLVHRFFGMPKVVGYSAVGALAGLGGFTGAAWPLQGIGLFLLEFGVSVVLFEAGGRIPLRWFRHNPMVLMQSLLESSLTLVVVYYVLRQLDVRADVAQSLAMVAMAASPAVLSRIVIDTRASGPVTERAMVLSTLSTLYALTLCTARAGVMNRPHKEWADMAYPILVVLGLSVVVGAVLALALRVALRVMSPTSENTSMLFMALLGGMLLKQLNPKPWAWPRQLGTAGSLLTMLMFVLVSVVAANAHWNMETARLVAGLVLARGLAKIVGVGAANWGSGLSWRQALYAGSAMSPMSSVALLLVSQFASSSPALPLLARIALPAILLMEVLGSILATVAVHRTGESSRSWGPDSSLTTPGELRG
jgi:Kef-type K+ transport system membrane component KefB